MMTFMDHWAGLADKNPGLRKCELIKIRVPELQRIMRLTWAVAQREERAAVYERNKDCPQVIKDLYGLFDGKPMGEA